VNKSWFLSPQKKVFFCIKIRFFSDKHKATYTTRGRLNIFLGRLTKGQKAVLLLLKVEQKGAGQDCLLTKKQDYPTLMED